MDSRLRTARRSVRAATRQAHAALVASDATIPADDLASNNDDFANPANDDHDITDRAGADLGLKLFGTSQSYMEKMEEEFAARLAAVEGELDEVQEGLAALDHEGGGGTPAPPERGHNHDEAGEEDTLSAEDIPTLKRHIAFLRECQRAHRLLDDVDTLSLSSNYATAGHATPRDKGDGVTFQYSPSSICSPGDFARFTFEAASPESGTGDSPMVRAAMLVKETEQILYGVGKGLEGGTEEGIDGHSRMQTEMLDQLRSNVLRKRMELRHRASALVQNCIVVEECGLLIKGSGTAEGASSNKRKVAFDVVESPISASTPTNNDGTAIAPSPMSDAYQVLETLSDADFPTFGKTLDGAMKELSKKIYEGVLQPCLAELDKSAAGKASREVAYYTFTRETLKSVRSRGGDRRHEAVSIRGPAARLGWTLSAASLGAEGDSGDAIIATAADIDEKALQSTSPAVAGFLASLNLLSNVLAFVHEHALLNRSDLAAMFGTHLFGTYPPRKSAMIGSEETSLMRQVINAMKGRCIPKEGGPTAWRTLQETKTRLVVEAGAFEQKMAKMGLMKESLGVAKQPTSPAAAASSSPTGLSVLVDSPIRSNDATAMNLSTLDTSFPTDKNEEPKEATGTALSPLSELALSLRQAYVESQRCGILNRGRSILLETDYHNTVRVGTNVPDLSEPGSLESLDDDLLTAAFALHRCSISSTTKQIMDMVRETLDSAVAADEEGDADRPDSLRPALYRASRELLDLFRAIIPNTHSSEVASVPRTAAVLHNDCVFLAHEALLLGAEYKGKFRSLDSTSEKTRLLGEACTFVDMVPLFRALATKSMGNMIEVQKGQLYELVTQRLVDFQRALASNESVSEWDDADTALRAALHHLRHLSQAWRFVLPRQIYNMSMGNLVDVVLTLFLDPVLRAEDITELASTFVHSLFLDAVKGTAEIFLAGDGNDDNTNALVDQTPINQDQRFQVARKYSTLFDKAQAVGLFMPMRLDEIERGLEEGAFKSVTAKELSHLIAAAFDDIPKRTALLNALFKA